MSKFWMSHLSVETKDYNPSGSISIQLLTVVFIFSHSHWWLFQWDTWIARVRSVCLCQYLNFSFTNAQLYLCLYIISSNSPFTHLRLKSACKWTKQIKCIEFSRGHSKISIVYQACSFPLFLHKNNTYPHFLLIFFSTFHWLSYPLF